MPGLGVTGIMIATGGNDAFTGASADTAFGGLSGSGGADVFAGLAPITRGTLIATEGHDTAALAGTCIIASLGYAEHHDTAAGSGSFTAAGSIAKTGGNDPFSGSGRDTAAGTAGPTGGNDEAALAGMAVHTSYLAGSGGADVFAGTGTRSSSAAIGPTERHDAFSGAGGAGGSRPAQRRPSGMMFSRRSRPTLAHRWPRPSGMMFSPSTTRGSAITSMRTPASPTRSITIRRSRRPAF